MCVRACACVCVCERECVWLGICQCVSVCDACRSLVGSDSDAGLIPDPIHSSLDTSSRRRGCASDRPCEVGEDV